MSDNATLVERMRKFHDEIVASDGAESGQMFMMREAADRIVELEAERNRLREALRPLASLADDGDARDYITVPILMSVIRRARAALSTKSNTPETQPTPARSKVVSE